MITPSLVRFKSESLPFIQRNPIYINKHLSKIKELVKGYLLTDHLKKQIEGNPKFNSEDFDLNPFLEAMNTPTMIKNSGLDRLREINTTSQLPIETDYLTPSGKVSSKGQTTPEVIQVSKPYLVKSCRIEGDKTIMEVANQSRLDDFIKNKKVKFHEISFHSYFVSVIEIQPIPIE